MRWPITSVIKELGDSDHI